ncbi:hypothetical protein GW17_00049184 [Ensete ventricosum]|nr:hypothetical protein GW17_00049184 [Ensete ventricosum]
MVGCGCRNSGGGGMTRIQPLIIFAYESSDWRSCLAPPTCRRRRLGATRTLSAAVTSSTGKTIFYDPTRLDLVGEQLSRFLAFVSSFFSLNQYKEETAERVESQAWMDMDPQDTCDDTDLSLGLGIGPANTASADDCRRRQRGCCSPCTNLFPDEPSLSLSLSDDASGGGRTMQKSEADRPAQLPSSRSAASSVSSAAYAVIPNNNTIKKKKEEDVGAEVERVSSRGSDEEENSSGRKKLRLTREQSALLEDRFKEHTTLNPVSFFTNPAWKSDSCFCQSLRFFFFFFLLLLLPSETKASVGQGFETAAPASGSVVPEQESKVCHETKLKQTEVDCEFLKKCYEVLTNENQRLHKELQELKALKFAPPLLHMQLPSAAALTMCPSCQRISSGGDAKGSSKAPKPGHCFNPFPHSAAC